MILSSFTGGYLFDAGRGLPLLAGGIACALGLLAAFFRRSRGYA
jgi:hypothetical protein